MKGSAMVQAAFAHADDEDRVGFHYPAKISAQSCLNLVLTCAQSLEFTFPNIFKTADFSMIASFSTRATGGKRRPAVSQSDSVTSYATRAACPLTRATR